MSNYCTVAQVQGWFKGVTFSTDTNPTLAKVNEIITRKSVYIDTRLDVVYETPITGANSLLLVQEICEFLVIADVEAIMKTGLGRTGDATKPVDYRKLGEDKIKRLETSESALGDAVSRSSNEFANYNEDNSVDDPVFKKDSTQW